ncbi:MAG: AIR synthase-related protein [Bacteroidota bacterium]
MKKNKTIVNPTKDLPTLTSEETELVKSLLHREPNSAETCVYATLWQECISFKNSIYHVKRFPVEGPQTLIRPGNKSTGFIDLGEGLASTVSIRTTDKIPYATNAYSGFWINGAKEILQIRRLRLGTIKSKSAQAQLKNCIDINGETNEFHADYEFQFDQFHERIPMQNVLSVGLARANNVLTNIAHGVGNSLYFAYTSDDVSKLKSAINEIIKTGAATGIMSVNDGGIIHTAAIMAANGSCGISIHTEKISDFQTETDAIERLINKQNEAVLLVCEKDRETEIELLFKFWELNYAQIGQLCSGEQLTIYTHGKEIVNIPAVSIVAGRGAPVYRKESKEPEYHLKSRKFNIDSVPQPGDLRPVVRLLLGHPDICSHLNQELPHTVNPASDTVHYQIPDSGKTLIASLCCNPRYVYTDPRIGTEITVAEAARRIVCRGGQPQAIACSLNFGDIQDAAKFWQYVQSTKGLNNACRKFNLVVNESKVNFCSSAETETELQPVFPEAVIGMMGIIDDKSGRLEAGFKNKGDVIFLIGESRNDINSSQYLNTFHRVILSPPPYFNPDKEFILQHHVHSLIQSRLINSAQSISTGGLFTALVKSGFQRDLGFDITTDSEIREDAFLFGEAQSRVAVTVDADNESDFIDYMFNAKIQATLLGHVTKGAVRVDDISFGTIKDMKDAWHRTFEMNSEASGKL